MLPSGGLVLTAVETRPQLAPLITPKRVPGGRQKMWCPARLLVELSQ